MKAHQNTPAGSSEVTTAPLTPAVNGAAPTPKPEFIRLPLAGSACPYSGLKRSKLNELVLPCPANGFKPQVRSVCLRQRGSKTGIRLVHYQSLIDYLYSQEVTA
jgi:hypothetical protein